MMRDFFGYVIDYDKSVQLFGVHHFLYAVVGLSAFLLPYLYVNKSTPWFKKRTVIVLLTMLIVFELYYHIQNYLFSSATLPLHVSSISLFMTMFLLMFPKNEKLIMMTFYLGVSAGFVALMVPLSYGFPYYNFRYYHFLIVHAVIIFFPVYALKSHPIRFSLYEHHLVFLIIVVMIPIMILVNSFLAQLPYDLFHNYWFVYEVPINLPGPLSIYPIYLMSLILTFYTILTILYWMYKHIIDLEFHHLDDISANV